MVIDTTPGKKNPRAIAAAADARNLASAMGPVRARG